MPLQLERTHESREIHEKNLRLSACICGEKIAPSTHRVPAA